MKLRRELYPPVRLQIGYSGAPVDISIADIAKAVDSLTCNPTVPDQVNTLRSFGAGLNCLSWFAFEGLTVEGYQVSRWSIGMKSRLVTCYAFPTSSTLIFTRTSDLSGIVALVGLLVIWANRASEIEFQD
jgi:hypothetical protein